MDVVVLQKTAESLPDFPYPLEGNFRLEDFKDYYNFTICEPAKELQEFIAYYSVFEPKLPPRHDLYFSQVLQVPAASLMFSRKRSVLFGVTSKRINHHAKSGEVKVRVMFKPAGLRAFCPDLEMTNLVDKGVPIAKYFSQFEETFTEELVSCKNIDQVASKLNDFLIASHPVADRNITLINELLNDIDNDEGIVKVAQLAARQSKSERWLQALFRSYVGVGIKWVIMRARLIKVLQSLDSSEDIPWSQVAADLGYTTQSHMINDFKKLIGRSPSKFVMLRN